MQFTPEWPVTVDRPTKKTTDLMFFVCVLAVEQIWDGVRSFVLRNGTGNTPKLSDLGAALFANEIFSAVSILAEPDFLAIPKTLNDASAIRPNFHSSKGTFGFRCPEGLQPKSFKTWSCAHTLRQTRGRSTFFLWGLQVCCQKKLFLRGDELGSLGCAWNYCIVPRCSVTFWTHPGIIPVGQFF